jgi:hypothetical protein
MTKMFVSGTVPARARNSSKSVLRDGGACLDITEHVQAHIQSHRQGIGWISTLSKDVFNQPSVLIVVLKILKLLMPIISK